MGAAAPAALADAGGRCKSAAAATAQRLRRSNPAAAAAAALVAPLLLLCFLASSIDAFVFPYPLLPTPQSQSQLQQPMQLLHAAPTLQARRALLALAAAPRCGPEEEEQAQAATKARRRPWRPASATVADRRDVLAAAAGVAAGSSWVLAAGAAATTTATAGSSKPAMAAAAGGDAYLCDDAISHLKDPKTGKEIYLIGTAHISNASAQLVRTTIRSVRPQTVMLELDEGRVRRVTEGAASQQAPATPVATTATQSGGGGGQAPPPKQPPPQPRQDKPGFLKMALAELTRPGTGLRDKLVGVGAVVVGQVIAGLYKTLDKMGFVSGQEFLVAMEEAKAVGATILLGDRNVQVTLRRLSEALSQSDLVKIREMESPTRSPAAKELAARGLDVGPGAEAKDIAVAVEALKDRDSVRKLMGALRQELPAVYEAMIAERDEYMANSLRDCPSKTIVAVVGMGHMDGIERNLGYQVLPCRLGGKK